MRLYLRHSVEMQHRVVIEVPLDHAALFDSDLAIEGGGEAPDDTALYLLSDGQWIHHVAAVDGTHDAFNPQLAPLAHRHFGNLCDDGAVALHNGNALSRSRWHGLSPLGFLSHRVKHMQPVGVALQQLAAQFNRILPRSIGQFVDETFYRKAILRGAH